MKRGVTGYTSNGRSAALMLICFLLGVCVVVVSVDGRLWEAGLAFVLCVTLLWVGSSEPGPNDPPRESLRGGHGPSQAPPPSPPKTPGTENIGRRPLPPSSPDEPYY